jgi:predicted regulator of Ras-like GTPase activity (Roadblock/LC7/MglB family)
MADNPLGDFFISDADDELGEYDEPIISAVVVPAVEVPTPGSEVLPNAPVVAPATPTSPAADAGTIQPPETTPRPAATSRQATREERLATALNDLMDESQEIQAAALVSLDGFTMASALPEGMHEDRVGAMSAAILGLGERAATELGRGQLSQVFIEGDDGYVMLIAAGDRAVLTCLADIEAKLGLVLYDMRAAADRIAEILG